MVQISASASSCGCGARGAGRGASGATQLDRCDGHLLLRIHDWHLPHHCSDIAPVRRSPCLRMALTRRPTEAVVTTPQAPRARARGASLRRRLRGGAKNCD